MIPKVKRYFWILVLILTPAIPLHAYFAGNWYSIFHSYSMGMFFGIISYVCFANTLILSARLPFLDKLFGQDRIMVLHGYLALFAIACAVTHAVFKNMYFGFEGVQVKLGASANILFTTVAVLTILFMVKSIIIRIPFIKAIRNFCLKSRLFDYSRIKLLHNITAVAMVLVTIHVMLAFPTSENNYRLVLTGSWGGISIAIYIYHKIIRLIWRQRQALTVSEVNILSDDILCITSKSEKFTARYKAGQFGYFRVFSPVCGMEEHPFTIASAPETGSLDIVIKGLGDYTEKLKNVTPGAKLLFDGPYGIFTPELNAHSAIFIAGGIGITPFLSIIRDWSKSEIQKPVTLIWSVKREEDLVYRDIFRDLAEKQNRFRYLEVITQNPGLPHSRINEELLTDILENEEMISPHAYLCGPKSLRKDLARTLRHLGIRRSFIHYESFGD